MENILVLSGRSTCIYMLKNYYFLERYFYSVFEAKKLQVLH